MSAASQAWKQLAQSFQEWEHLYRGMAENADDEQLRQQYLAMAEQYQAGQTHIAQIQSRDAAYAEAQKQAAERAQKLAQAKLASAKKAADAWDVDEDPKPPAEPAFDRMMGERLKRSMMVNLQIWPESDSARRGKPGHEIEEWASTSSTQQSAVLRGAGTSAASGSAASAGTGPGVGDSSADARVTGSSQGDMPPVSQRHPRYRDRVASLAVRLPRREAVWWGLWMAAQLVNEDHVSSLSSRVPIAQLIYHWVLIPSEENAQKIAESHELPGLNLPSGCIGHAVIWRGRPTPVDLDLDHPTSTAEAVARAMLLMADLEGPSQVDPGAFLALSLEEGDQIRRGHLLWENTGKEFPVRSIDESWDDLFNQNRNHGF